MQNTLWGWGGWWMLEKGKMKAVGKNCLRGTKGNGGKIYTRDVLKKDWYVQSKNNRESLKNKCLPGTPRAARRWRWAARREEGRPACPSPDSSARSWQTSTLASGTAECPSENRYAAQRFRDFGQDIYVIRALQLVSSRNAMQILFIFVMAF